MTFLGVPLAEMCNENFRESARAHSDEEHRLRRSADAPRSISTWPIVERAAGREIRQEEGAARVQSQARSSWATITPSEHFDCPLPFHLEKMDANGDKILIDGNTATALGCVYAGATVAAWYPITPSTSVMDAFKMFCEQYRRDPETGKNNFLILQAEDELAAIGMVIGASWNGARAFTSTAGPGHFADERTARAWPTTPRFPRWSSTSSASGPSTGMPTRTQQGDILECAYASHGDTQHILLFPSNPAECFEFAVKSFDLAERFQTPVFMLSDLDIGMNDWVIAAAHLGRFLPPRPRPRADRRGAREDRRSSSAIRREDENHVAARTLPGVDSKGAFFTRGSGHNKFGGYTEIPDEYQEVMDRLLLKHKAAAKFVPRADDPAAAQGARFGIVTLGGCDPAVREALDILAARACPPITCAFAVPVRRERRGVPRRPRILFRGRAESRRAAADRC